MAEFQKLLDSSDDFIRVSGHIVGKFINKKCPKCDNQLMMVYGFDFKQTGTNYKNQPVGYPICYKANHSKTIIVCDKCLKDYQNTKILEENSKKEAGNT